MKNKLLKLFAVLLTLQLLVACSGGGVDKKPTPTQSKSTATKKITPPKKHGKIYPKATKKVYLTFDDGPGIYTSKIIDILNKYNAKAVFFDIGINAKRYPEIEKLVVKDKMKIGNHSYKHDDYDNFSNVYINNDLKKTSAIIKKNTGVAPRCMRPPYGATSHRVNNIIKRNHMTMQLWDADSLDWSMPGVQHIINNSLLGLKDGNVLLFHAAGGNRRETVEALPKILDYLKEHGYSPELLNNC